MNVLLMSCRSPFLDNDRVYPALATLYLKSFVNLKLPEVNIDLADEYDLTNYQMFEPYDFVGVSIMTPQREEALKILHTVKAHYPNKKVIAGGPHIKHYLSDIIEANEPYDFLVPLDGEKALVQILSDPKCPRVVMSMMSREEIGAAPIPDRTSHQAKNILKKYSYNLNGRDSSTIMTSRGCPQGCKFCEDARTTSRWSSLDNIKQELDDIVALGYKGVYIFDDLFALSLKMVKPICEELKKRDLVYRCNGQARYFNEEFAKTLAETGCVEIAFGAESGSQKILDVVDKSTTVAQNYKFVELCIKYGIKCKAFVMIGLPGETKETIAETEQFIKTSGIDDFQLSIYYPFKGTKFREEMDSGKDIGLYFDKEGLGAYGQKGGKSEAIVRTASLTQAELLSERDRLVNTYRPKSHNALFETHLNTKVEY